MNVVEFAENVLGLKLLDYQKTYLSMFDKDKCQECKKIGLNVGDVLL